MVNALEDKVLVALGIALENQRDGSENALKSLLVDQDQFDIGLFSLPRR